MKDIFFICLFIEFLLSYCWIDLVNLKNANNIISWKKGELKWKKSPLYDLIPEVIPRVFFSQILVEFFPGYSEGAFHVSAKFISILDFTSNVNDVVFVSRVTVPVIVSTLSYLLPYLRFSRRLVCRSDKLHLLKTSHVREILF